MGGVIVPVSGGIGTFGYVKSPLTCVKYIRQRAFYVKSLPRNGRNHLASDSARRLRAATISASAFSTPVQ